ncbi:MAG: thioredoxin family protein [Gammaproteobacteria bacterium]|nr:thioredoxin family protein [Gammaproteobacteria bacterium]
MTRFGTLAALSLLMLISAGCNFESSVTVGMNAPAIKTKTLQDVGGDFSRITTYRYPDGRMYQYSLDQALALHKPVVLEFATPGHCTVCDNQLQMMKAMLSKYESEVIFLHMDQYQNPEAFRAFKVIGDPWTFIIDKNGVVRYKQAGRMLYGELDAVISQVMMGARG